MDLKDRIAFENALVLNKYDQTTRLIFADWLEEYGFDDEAVFHREWTKEWQKSKDWLEEFARDNIPLGYDFMMESAENIIKTGYAYIGDDDAKDAIDRNREEFWKHYEVVMKTEVDEDIKERYFSCSC